jgi:hypothetical protein
MHLLVPAHSSLFLLNEFTNEEPFPFSTAFSLLKQLIAKFIPFFFIIIFILLLIGQWSKEPFLQVLKPDLTAMIKNNWDQHFPYIEQIPPEAIAPEEEEIKPIKIAIPMKKIERKTEEQLIDPLTQEAKFLLGQL